MHIETKPQERTEAIFKQIRTLIGPLTAEERLWLIRDVLTNPTQEQDIGIDKQPQTKNEIEVVQSRENRRQKLKEEQLAWYARPLEERQQYIGQYVALQEGEVVDSDTDKQLLYLRIRQRFHRKPIPIIPAKQDELPTITIRGPRLRTQTESLEAN